MVTMMMITRGDVGDPGPEGLIGAKGEPGRDGLPGENINDYQYQYQYGLPGETSNPITTSRPLVE